MCISVCDSFMAKFSVEVVTALHRIAKHHNKASSCRNLRQLAGMSAFATLCHAHLLVVLARAPPVGKPREATPESPGLCLKLKASTPSSPLTWTLKASVVTTMPGVTSPAHLEKPCVAVFS